jgi:transposase
LIAIFLEGFAGARPAHVHAVMALEQAGWHGSKKLTVPNNVSLAPLPPYSPELNPADRIWLLLRERFLVLSGPRRPGSRHRCLL